MVYKKELNRILSELRERQSDLLSELETLPEGVFLATVQDERLRYFQRLPAVGNRKKERRFGVGRRPEVLHGLVRKEYVKKALLNIGKDIEIISAAIEKYLPSDENTVMQGFASKHPELAHDIYKNQIDIQAWKSMQTRIDEYHRENLNQVSKDGVFMRSKNEVYIASRLDHYNLIYKSDCPTEIPGLKAVPDFTILRKRDSKIIYWEHMGMMDDENYRLRNRKKLLDYERAGIVPWDNLILTYDAAGGGLRANMIEAMIQVWLL